MSGRITEEDLLGLIRKLDHAMAEEDPAPLEASDEEELSERHGAEYIQVSNNSIQVHAMKDGSLTIEALPPVLLSINGKPVQGTASVGPQDKLDWSIEHSPLFVIDITPDHMQALLTVKATERYAQKLKDKPPSLHMLVEAEVDPSIVLDKLRLSDVMAELQNRKISKNIKAPLIFKEIQSPTFLPILIAHGVDIIPSEDARMELFFSEKIENSFEEVDGSVDFRNHLRIPTARKGEIIAKKYPPVSGSIGYDVFGNILKPVPPKDIIMFAKENTEITAGEEVVALTHGRPRMTGTSAARYFDITTAHIVSNDVDLKTGNIVFSGDVIVYGNVMEGMIIESLGNVYITGNVYQATITATGSICIKGNIISSKLFSGYFGVIFNRLYIHTKKLSELLQQLLEASKLLIQVVEARGKSSPINQIVVMLVETKFNEIPKVAKELMMTIHNIQNIAASEMLELKQKMQLLLNSSNLMTIHSLNEILSIRNLVTETFEMVQRMQESHSTIDIPKCQLTEIKSTGSTVIRGEGVLQSNLYAKEDIIFLNKDSVFRGGQMECGGIISAYKVGGEHGSEALLKAGKKIILKRMSAGRLVVGRQAADVTHPIENVAAIVKDNRLVLQPLDSEGE